MIDELRELIAPRPDLELSGGFVEAAHERGDVCRAARRDGKVVGYTWRSTNGFTPHQDHVWISYPPAASARARCSCRSPNAGTGRPAC